MNKADPIKIDLRFIESHEMSCKCGGEKLIKNI